MKIKIVCIAIIIFTQQCNASAHVSIASSKNEKANHETDPRIQKVSKKHRAIIDARLEEELLKSQIDQAKATMNRVHGYLKYIHADNFEQPIF